MDEAAESVRQHPIFIEAAVVTPKSQPREEGLGRVEIIARKNGRETLLHGAIPTTQLSPALAAQPACFVFLPGGRLADPDRRKPRRP